MSRLACPAIVEIGNQCLRGLIAALRRLLERPPHDGPELRTRTVGLEFRHDGERVEAGFGSGAAGERLPAGQQFVEDHAEREQIGAAIGGSIVQLLGRHVAGRPDDGAGRRVDATRHPEIDDFDRVASRVLRQQDVLGFDIAVHEAAVVCLGKRTRHLSDDRPQHICSRRSLAAAPVPVQPRAQADALDVLHHDARGLGVKVGVVHGDDIRVDQARCVRRFLREGRGQTRSTGDDLDCNDSTKRPLNRLVDLAHASDTHRSENEAVSNRVARPADSLKRRGGAVVPRIREQRLDVGQQRVAAFTGDADEGRPVMPGEFEGGGEDLVSPEPQLAVVKVIVVPQGGTDDAIFRELTLQSAECRAAL